MERWFAELTNKWLRRGTHRSIEELAASITHWVELGTTIPAHMCGARRPTRSSTVWRHIANESQNKERTRRLVKSRIATF